jgi:tRNA G18 (ribose-2'-O)-methylase SpoU
VASALSLSKAADLTGKSKSVISGALKRGDLTGLKNSKGQYEIDKSELERVYGTAIIKNAERNKRTVNRTFSNRDEEQQKQIKNNTLQRDIDAAVELATLRARVDILEGQGGLIETLRDRADHAEERADRAEERERSLLTDQRPKSRSWWPFTR